jgi:hypothetical protein
MSTLTSWLGAKMVCKANYFCLRENTVIVENKKHVVSRGNTFPFGGVVAIKFDFLRTNVSRHKR